MQIPKKTWDKYIKQLSSLNNTAGQLVADYIEENGIEDKKALTDYAYSVIQKYGNGSAALSAAMYDTIAAIEGASVPPAVMAELPQYDEVAKTVYGTLKTSHNTSEISSAASRLVKRTGADTTLWNVKRDGAQFAWVPAGDTCPFCLALASNGWQYMSKEAIKGGHAEHIHANCDCTYAVRFDNETKVPGYDPKKYKEMYDDAEGKNSKDKINSLRRMKYEENKDKINAQKRAAYAERKSAQTSNKYRLSAIKSEEDGKTKLIELGNTPENKKQEVIDRYKEELRNEPIEHAIIIQEDGRTVHFVGSETGVSLYDVSLENARILHNHPEVNGIVSFGEDDFGIIRDYPSAKYDLCNKDYDYSLEVIKDISKLSYNDLEHMPQLDYYKLNEIDDMQHEIMNAFKENGYVKYERVERGEN